MLTQERLKQVLYYNPHVGVFVWRDKSKPYKYGRTAGKVGAGRGYVTIAIDKIPYTAHRLAWLYAYGSFPDHQVDHIDGDRSNNLLSNLRAATQSQNSMNMKINASNTSGVKGVWMCNQTRKWAAVVRHNKKFVFREYFAEKDDAVAAIQAFRESFHGEFANHGVHKYESENTD